LAEAKVSDHKQVQIRDGTQLYRFGTRRQRKTVKLHRMGRIRDSNDADGRPVIIAHIGAAIL
jgi:hypothetical protein